MALKLLCDEMLSRLARWLRAAGHDTALAEAGLSDADVLARARREGRGLITTDHGLAAEAQGKVEAVLLSAEGVKANARDLSQRLAVDWLAAPFTRCVLDNTPLRDAGPADRLRMPEAVRASDAALRVCPTCGRAFWPGGHVRRMRERLERWRAEEFG